MNAGSLFRVIEFKEINVQIDVWAWSGRWHLDSELICRLYPWDYFMVLLDSEEYDMCSQILVPKNGKHGFVFDLKRMLRDNTIEKVEMEIEEQ